MAYKLLGWVTWHLAKWFLRRKYGSATVPAPVLAAGVVVVALGVAGALAARQHGRDGS